MQITSTRTWDAMDMIDMCVKNNLYTCGNRMDYDKMLDYVGQHENPEDMDIYLVASDILQHTDESMEHTIETIMYLVANQVIRYLYDIEYSDAEKIIARAEGQTL